MATPQKHANKKGADAKAPKSSGPSFINHVIIPLAFAPLIFSTLVLVGRTLGPKLFESTPLRPAFVTLPYFGGSVGPAVLGLALYLVRSKSLSFLPGFLAKLAIFLPVILLGLHNFFTVLYGNINNDAWSDSIMIDVIGPPSTFNAFTRFPANHFTLAKDPTVWANESIIAGPHLQISEVQTAACGPRSFARIMHHIVLSNSRVAKLLDTNVMFGGIWVMAEGVSGARVERPKVFTDFAYGNDPVFNNLMRWLFVDEFNWYGNYNYNVTETLWSIDSDILLYNGHGNIRAAVDGQIANRQFVMDQYSCMSESNWLADIFGSHWCFYKHMDPTSTFSLEGSVEHPSLSAGKLEFPQGDATDCSKPYVRAVLAKGLHWVRPTYEC